METNNIDLREEYYNKTYSLKSKWWMHWGIAVVCAIVLIIMILGQVIKYPDTVESEFRLSSQTPSIMLPVKNGRQIDQLFFKNNDQVEKGQAIVLFENEANYKDVLQLEAELKDFSFEKDSLVNFFDQFLKRELLLGQDITAKWTLFSRELLDYYKIQKLETYKDRIQYLNKELTRQLRLEHQYEELAKTDVKQRALIQKQMRMDSSLFEKGVISRLAYNRTKTRYFEDTKRLQTNQLALSRVRLEITKLQNAMASTGDNEEEILLSKKIGMRESLYAVISSIELWKNQNLLVAPLSGKLTYVQDIKEGGFYTGNAFYISSADENYYASVRIPLRGAGKIKESQAVILQLNDYPYKEFGVIRGQLDEFNSVPGENYYLGKVLLNHDESNYGERLPLRENMTGVCKIITNERSVLGRIFEKITYAFQKA